MMTHAAVQPEFWKDRRVLLTGHTGFKGAWAALWLSKMGAKVTGLSLPPDDEFSLYRSLADRLQIDSCFVDIRNAEAMETEVRQSNPEIILHMAAQALVRRSYREPRLTFETNVTGTINLLEAMRELPDLKAALIITSDKVYRNIEDGRAFQETDPLGGDDPYSASKAACEIATASYAKSLFPGDTPRIATARAGNVIGGGDFSEDRLIPDIWRAARNGKSVTLRFPGATRPWQHVLESVSGYLVYLQALAGDGGTELPKALNFGPQDGETITVGEIARNVQKAFGIEGDWSLTDEAPPPEKMQLALDASLAREILGWQAKWRPSETLSKTVDWYKAYRSDTDIYAFTLSQIEEYEAHK
tara:strand:- start:32071 stop:33147 length:1077 start_codon:yes stop_codon:yes gene_type:complete